MSLELGPVPWEEDCQQTGTPDYDEAKARLECKVYKRMLLRLFPIPEGVNARFTTRSFSHDFGRYLEVCLDSDPFSANGRNDLSALLDYEDAVTDGLPAEWDAIARFELAWFDRQRDLRTALTEGRLAHHEIPAQYLQAEPPQVPVDKSLHELFEAFRL